MHSKFGILIGAIFSVLPFPLLYRAVTKGDPRELMSLSVPATVMGLTCTSAVFAFCSMKGMDDCVTSSYLGFVSSGLTLGTIYTMRGQFFTTFAAIVASQIAIIYCVTHVFSLELTNAVTLTLNTLACVLGPLDTLENLLRTRDIRYMNYAMHGLAVVNGIIWTLYHFEN